MLFTARSLPLTGAPLRGTRREAEATMHILLYNPDNEITHNFMPHLWMFLLKSLTPAGHNVLLVDGNAQRLSETELVQYVRENHIALVGIGAMTRMVRKAYQMADAVRAAGVPVVMGVQLLPQRIRSRPTEGDSQCPRGRALRAGLFRLFRHPQDGMGRGTLTIGGHTASPLARRSE